MPAKCKTTALLRSVVLIAGALSALALCVGGCSQQVQENAQADSEAVPIAQVAYQLQGKQQQQTYLRCRHYQEQDFRQAVEQAEPYPVAGKLLAATAPHFRPVGQLIANVLCTIQTQAGNSPTIYVLAPNHSGKGLPLIVADRGWDTPWGKLEYDAEATAAILREPELQGEIDVDVERLEHDHSAATLIPFIKYYLPEANVVTVLLSRSLSIEKVQVLADLIYEESREKEVLLLGSIDFSHYLPISETAERDEITQELIENRDYLRLKTLDGGNLDCPEAMIALLRYCSYYSESQAERVDQLILEESEIRRQTGYSYNVYVFEQPL